MNDLGKSDLEICIGPSFVIFGWKADTSIHVV